MGDRQATRRMTPVCRWRWLVRSGVVYHCFEAASGPQERWTALCRLTGMESALEPDQTERCRACTQALARAGDA